MSHFPFLAGHRVCLCVNCPHLTLKYSTWAATLQNNFVTNKKIFLEAAVAPRALVIRVACHFFLSFFKLWLFLFCVFIVGL